jgi:O-acetyl-ADP-ribose deacetylase (regulator of RNase III)
MIRYKVGNLLESDMQTLVNTVNCVGVMGKGIALAFKNRYPAMYRDYELRCRRAEVKPGVPYRYPDLPGANQLSLDIDAHPLVSESNPVILIFPTKDHWRSKSKREYVVRGLERLRDNHDRWDIQSIAFPALGCGNGGLDWLEIGPLMRDYLTELDIPVEIYVPPGIDPETPFTNRADLLVAHSSCTG